MPKTAARSIVTLDEAIETFARGFAFTRSRTHPYLAERIGKMWLLRDGPRRNADYRREEWVTNGLPPRDVDRTARARTRGRFCICAIRAIDEPDDELRAEYKRLGYRLGTTEPLMVHDLRRIPKVPIPLPVKRITTDDAAQALAKAAGHTQIALEQLRSDPPRVRQYAAYDGDTPIGWAQSIVVGATTWCSNVYVEPSHRRRGIGRSLMARILKDDRSAGVKASVLLASHTGSRLYESVGYQHIGELLLYTPKK